ncbi:MAG TPA: hypothetical protein VKU00_02080 [Chthonomonadaceae bacterium]|nr:hypothetical protein [Chthonomonadaceae bacterium]
MELTIELNEEEAACLKARAQEQGVDTVEVVRSLIAGLVAEQQPTEYEATRALFAQWAVEDATEDPEKIAAAERELAEFKANMNAHRIAEGRPPVYPWSVSFFWTPVH